jgi:hypothetical protein
MLCFSTRSQCERPLHHTLNIFQMRAVTAARFMTAAGTCPRNGTLVLSTNSAPGAGGLVVPVATRSFYPGLADPFKIFLEYPTLAPGGSFCLRAGSRKIAIGGTLLFKTNVAGTTCVKPPTKADGSSCCTMMSWQPNSDGLYLPGCSISCAPSARPAAWASGAESQKCDAFLGSDACMCWWFQRVVRSALRRQTVLDYNMMSW